MKYIKKFEQSELSEPKYKKGDYVLITKFGHDHIYKGYCLLFTHHVGKSYSKHEHLYGAKFIDKNTFEIDTLAIFLDETEIDRKMTKSEIDDFELTLKTNKYNL